MSAYRRVGLLVACFGVCASIASAAVFSYTGTFSGAPGTGGDEGDPLEGTVDLPKYRFSESYDLESVVISGSVSLEGFMAELENTGSTSAYITEYTYGMRGVFTIVPTSTQDTVNLDRSSYDISVPVEGSVTFDPESMTAGIFTFSGTVASANFGLFTGMDTFSISYSITQRSLLESSGSLAATITPGTAEGWMKVDYTIPEPATGTFWGLCGVMLVLRRRFRARG
jgi:hypothetical protein